MIEDDRFGSICRKSSGIESKYVDSFGKKKAKKTFVDLVVIF